MSYGGKEIGELSTTYFITFTVIPLDSWTPGDLRGCIKWNAWGSQSRVHLFLCTHCQVLAVLYIFHPSFINSKAMLLINWFPVRPWIDKYFNYKQQRTVKSNLVNYSLFYVLKETINSLCVFIPDHVVTV